MFDPYHKWLAIPKGQRPPSHYQLLGVAPDERDAEVIAEAAIRQSAHVRTYQTGSRARQCIRLLNEIAQARATLLDPDRRRAYDESVRDAAAEESARLRPSLPDPPPATDPELPSLDSLREGKAPVEPSVSGAAGDSLSRPSRETFCLTPLVVAYTLLLLLGGILGFWAGWR